MNYSHAFHAGCAADVVKHVLLSHSLRCLGRDASRPLFVLDTHAAALSTDLAGPEALRTGEARRGVLRLSAAVGPAGQVPELVEPYWSAQAPCLEGQSIYLGSPGLILASLGDGGGGRGDRRVILNERKPETAASLRADVLQMRPAAAVSVTQLNGFHALKAFCPPQQRRGLVLVDPAFEDEGDWQAITESGAEAVRKWPTGCFLFWLPIKPERSVEVSAFVAAVGDRIRAAPNSRNGRWLEVTSQEPIPKLHPQKKTEALRSFGVLCLNLPHETELALEEGVPWLMKALGAQAQVKILR
jgi:23S rRNA (adenine2030-N6)-methyltransferase